MSDNTKKTILVVDDALSSRAILRKVFAQDYDLLEAENGKRALELLRENPHTAVVVLDIVMPELDGFGVLAAMQGDETLKQVPVIVMTASSDDETQMKALSAGAMDVLYKPINPQVTRKRVENLIARMDAVRLNERNLAMERELKEAETDVISGIYNKNAFLRHAGRYIAEHPDGDFILMRWDIDNFKIYNDMFGSAEGDEYLRRVGEEYRRHGKDVPGLIIYARYEADHFVCLYDAGAFDARKTARRLLSRLQQDKSYSFDYSPRMGLYIVDDRSVDVALMCDRALLALKSIKNEYDARWAWYQSSMRDELIREHEIANQMKHALEDGQFRVYFQPQYDYVKNTIIGAEALVRWIHPEKGVIPPDMFIPVFEKNGFIYELDRFVWERACMYMKQWRDDGVVIPPISISVNISRKDLYQPDMIDKICAMQQHYGIAPAELHLEITESAYIDNPEQVVKVVSKLRERGFRVEMDDFGSGYSSLNTLKDVPVDMLKLDMKFLSQDSRSGKGGKILSSIVRMAHEIDLPVIAEGVETRPQAEFLKSIGCTYMQGYYFSRPMPADDFESLLKAGTIVRPPQPDLAVGVDGGADFMEPNTQSTLLFNSYVGGAAILEYHAYEVAAVRTNDSFYTALGTDRESYAEYQYHMLERFDADNRKLFIDALDNAVATGTESECELCSLPFSEGGEPIWTKCRFRCLTRKQGSYLFYLSVENISKRKQLETELERGKATLENIINSIPGGVATYEVRPDCFHLVYASDGVSALTGRTPEEYRALLNDKKATGVYPPDEKKVTDAIHGAMDTGGTVDINYRVSHVDGSIVWLNLRGRAIGESNGYPLFNAVYHDLSVTTELYFRILDDATSAIVVADRQTEELLFVNKIAAELAGRPQEDANGMICKEYFTNWTLPCGRAAAGLPGNGPFDEETDYNGRHYAIRVTRIDWNGRDAYISYISDRTDAWSKQKRTDEILSNIPGGAAIFKVMEDGRCVRVYMNEGAYEILGYEPGEPVLTEMNDAELRVYSEDVDAVKRRMRECIKSRSIFDMDMRIVLRSGGLRWINLKGKPFTGTDGGLGYYGLFLDITDRKRMEEELRVREQEYRVAAEQSGVNIYRYDIKERSGRFDGGAPVYFNVPAEIRDIPEYAVNKGLVADKSAEDWRSFFKEIDSGAAGGGADVLLNLPDGSTRWFRMRFSGVRDSGGRPAFAVITFNDVTNEIENLLAAKKQADTDGMTGIYNHAAAERIISEMISVKSHKPSALILLDVDDLKLINDTMGHPEGDRTLTSVAQTLKRHFRSTDVIGRMGGDEFVAMLPGMPNEKTLAPSLKVLLKELNSIRVGENDDYTIHCSMGCTFLRGGDSFMEVYRQADVALYHVKRAEKNGFAFYSPDMQQAYRTLTEPD